MENDLSYFDDNEDYIVFGGGRGGGRRSKWGETCTRCGAGDLKWRLNDAGQWRLYENERVEHNRLKEHVCGREQPDADDFDDLS